MVGAQHPGREGTWGQRESGRAFEDRGHLRTEGEEPGREGWGGCPPRGEGTTAGGGVGIQPGVCPEGEGVAPAAPGYSRRSCPGSMDLAVRGVQRRQPPLPERWQVLPQVCWVNGAARQAAGARRDCRAPHKSVALGTQRRCHHTRYNSGSLRKLRRYPKAAWQRTVAPRKPRAAPASVQKVP